MRSFLKAIVVTPPFFLFFFPFLLRSPSPVPGRRLGGILMRAEMLRRPVSGDAFFPFSPLGLILGKCGEEQREKRKGDSDRCRLLPPPFPPCARSCIEGFNVEAML